MGPADIILLRPTLALRSVVYGWMISPGIVENMMGPPTFPDAPVPTAAEFEADWLPHFWTHEEPERGRIFVVACDGELVGMVGQNELVTTPSGKRAIEIDTWLARADLRNRGYGSRSVAALFHRIVRDFAIDEAFLQPSARNPSACRAYEKAGFQRSTLRGEEAARHYRTGLDFHDSVFYVRRASDDVDVSATIQSR